MNNTADTHPQADTHGHHRRPPPTHSEGPIMAPQDAPPQHAETHPITKGIPKPTPDPQQPETQSQPTRTKLGIDVNGTLLSSQGTDTHRNRTHTQPRGNPSKLRLPRSFGQIHRNESSENDLANTRRPLGPLMLKGPNHSAGSSRRDRPPLGVRSSRPGGIENTRQPFDKSQIHAPGCR
jgi:hypothetical protein